MSIEILARRLALSLAIAGFGSVFAAVLCWSGASDASEVVRSVHNVGGSIMAVFGGALIVVGLTLSAGAPSSARPAPLPSPSRADSSQQE